jgi:uncharacterized protein (DUF1697 family)
MSVFVTFLRGVNITGHNKIKMTDLISVYKKLGFTDAITYIQSGNVVFSFAGKKESIAAEIENMILKKFSYDVRVMVRTAEEVHGLNKRNPYIHERDFDPSKSAVIFLYEEPDKIQLSKVADINYPPDRFFMTGKEIFIYCPNGFGSTKLYTNFFEGKMKVTGTARNWKTVAALTEIVTDFSGRQPDC